MAWLPAAERVDVVAFIDTPAVGGTETYFSYEGYLSLYVFLYEGYILDNKTCGS